MKCLLAITVVFLTGCISIPVPMAEDGTSRVTIEIENPGAYPIEVRAGAGIFSRKIILVPGEKRDDLYIDRRWPISRVKISIREIR